MFRRFLLLAAGAALAAPAPTEAQSEPAIIYLVRHAERADDGAVRDMWDGDPPLSEAGAARAGRLAELLGDAGVTHLHSTDLLRTRSTIEPLARVTGLDVALYAAADVGRLAERLVSTPGVHVVAGHSDTTPDLVTRLGGEPGEPIEPLEYDRAYVVHVRPSGAVGSAVFRFGAR